MKQVTELMIQARNDAHECIHELAACLQSDRLVPVALGTNLSDVMSSIIQLQNECCTLLQKSELESPATISELIRLGEDLKHAFQLANRAEQARETIRMFAQLQCQSDEIVDEFIQHQSKAVQLLQHPLSDEEVIEASKVYEAVVSLVRNPLELDNRQDLFQQINKSIGFVTKYALEQGFLSMPLQESQEEVAASSATTETSEQTYDSTNEQSEELDAWVNELSHKPVAAAVTTEAASTVGTEQDAQVADSILEEKAPRGSTADCEVGLNLETNASSIPFGNCIDFNPLEHTCYEKGKENFSANKFERELRKVSGSLQVSAYVMDYIYYHGVLALSQLEEIVKALPGLASQDTNASRDMVHGVLQKLCQKGYLSAHAITLHEDADMYYFLSEYGAGAFRKETSRKFIQSRSQLRMITRRTNDTFVKLEFLNVVSGVYRLRLLNRAQHRLEQEWPRDMMLTYTGTEPFPHRELSSNRTGKRFVLIPGALDAASPEEDLKQIAETLGMHADLIPIIIVHSIEDGKKRVEQLSTVENPAYFLLFDEQTLIVGDKEAVNCCTSLFEIEEPESVEDPAPLLQEATVEETSQDTAALAVNDTDQEPSGLDAITDEQDTGASHVGANPAIGSEDLAHVVETALLMLSKGRQAESMMLLHSVADYSEEVKVLRNKIAFILADPLRPDEEWHSLADTPVNLPFYDSESLDDFLNAALWLRTFFEPDHPNDYLLNTRWRQINSDLSSRVLEQNPRIKELIGYFWSFIERYNVGIKYCASADVRDQLDITQSLEQCRQKINDTLNTVFPRNFKSPINHAKVHHMVTELYGNSGVLTQMLQNAFTMPLHDLRDACQKFTGVDLSGGFDILSIQPYDHKLDQYMDEYWASMKFKANDNNDPLKGNYRNRMRSWLRTATEPLLMCYSCRYHAEGRQGTTGIPPEAVRKTRQKALELMEDALHQLTRSTTFTDEAGKSCLQFVIRQFKEVLGNRQAVSPSDYYESLLLSGEIELDEDYLPILDEQWLQDVPPIAGYQMWERLLRHCDQELPSWEEAANRALRNYDMGMYDLIVKRCGEQWHVESVVHETRTIGESEVGKIKEIFLTAVESAQNYGQMASNDEMYGYFRLAEAAEKHAKETKNVGFFKRLLEACRKQITRGSDARMEATRSMLDALKTEILQNTAREVGDSDEEVLQQWPIFDQINRMLDKRNMTVAEDYIRLAGSGQKNTLSIQMSDKDLYSLFMDKYQLLYNACNNHKGVDLYRTYEPTVRNILFPNQNNRNTTSADKFIRSWSKPNHLKELMEQLIFHEVSNVVKTLNRENEFYVYPVAHDAKLGQYPHPFEAFGTRAVRNGVRVLRMAGMRTVESLLGEVAQQGAGEGSATIVILDYALSLAERRSLAKEIKLRPMPEIIVVIDRVMTLFLAGYHQAERGKVFLTVALPSSKVQPYIPEGTIPPEMFIGRSDELHKIQDPKGPVFIYGGRQLGKTALLRESKNREHDPDNGRFAIFVDLKTKTVDEALRRISEELVAERVLDQPCVSWDDLSAALRLRLASKERPIRKLMLLLDEADAFIASCEHNHYRPIEMLKELKDSYDDRFKFVLAGLRDVVRFNKKRLSGNSVLAHLGHITIRPLKYLDARDLLLRPLQYLGFRISEKSEDIISLILAKTNYYPGLIHFYCRKLIEAIADSYGNGTYSDSSTPPYVLDEKHIKTLLGQSEFLAEIDEKFQITLQLDTDNYYYDILAKAMAYHYYERGVGQGASVQDIIRICQYFEIHKIGKMTDESVKALLEEMDELNIFRQETRGTGTYVFNRYSFFQMLGNEDQVFNHLIEYSGPVEG